jgi:hypothetical protein
MDNPIAPSLTRATWRKGKKRRGVKRVKPYAGKTVAPVALLEASKRTQFQKGMVGSRLCGKIKRDGTACRKLALRELDCCEWHGGLLSRARRGVKAQPAQTRYQKEPRACEALPLELVALPIYRSADAPDRARLLAAWGTDQWSRTIKSV